jgi:general secretion pathway protein A
VKFLQNDYEYFTKFNWNSNPFTLTIDPQLMVGYSDQGNSLLSHVHNLHKFALISGPTGSGKTTLMLWLRSQLMAFKKFYPHYISKPPRSSKELVALFKSFLGFNIIDKVRYGDLSLFGLQKFVVRKLKNKQFVLLIDEAHESSVANLEWVRTIADSIPNLYIIFAGLPIFEKNAETQLPTLFMRITTKTYLNNLTKTETESLIQKRIENSGGEGLKPFTNDAVERIHEITGGFPREIIKICDQLVKIAAEKNISSINRSFIDQIIKISEATEPVEMQAPLSQKQKEILGILNKNPDLTPSQIISHFPTEEYKDRDNAVRSINNILKRLLKDELIQRKKLGNSYVYFLTGKAKTVFTEA